MTSRPYAFFNACYTPPLRLILSFFNLLPLFTPFASLYAQLRILRFFTPFYESCSSFFGDRHCHEITSCASMTSTSCPWKQGKRPIPRGHTFRTCGAPAGIRWRLLCGRNLLLALSHQQPKTECKNNGHPSAFQQQYQRHYQHQLQQPLQQKQIVNLIKFV